MEVFDLTTPQGRVLALGYITGNGACDTKIYNIIKQSLTKPSSFTLVIKMIVSRLEQSKEPDFSILTYNIDYQPLGTYYSGYNISYKELDSLSLLELKKTEINVENEKAKLKYQEFEIAKHEIPNSKITINGRLAEGYEEAVRAKDFEKFKNSLQTFKYFNW